MLQQGPPPTLARAESLLDAGHLRAALPLAQRLVRAAPDDPAALMLLGRIRLAWPVFGRYEAESLFARAAQLEPANPAPSYYLARTGLKLGDDEGEGIARRALLAVIGLQPDYRDAWQAWKTLYRDDAMRRAMVIALAAHAGTWPADLWRAELLVELRAYGAAVPLLDSLAAAQPRDPVPHAYLARALFEQGRDSAATEAYEAALARAAADTGDVLWHQVRSIASPRERAEYARTGPAGRAAFLRLFWARRDPDVGAPLNARLGEHFRRLAEARRLYALLHPAARYHHSRLRRAVLGGLGAPPGLDLESIRADIAATRQPRLADQPVAAGLAGGLGAPGEETANLEDGLDDRGRILVRYGEPDERYVWSLDAETWRYDLPEGQMEVTFARRTADGGGDEVVTPVVAGELEAARYLLATDRPSLAATLRFAFWLATFRAGGGSGTELVLFPDSVEGTAVLYDAAGGVAARDSATAGPLHLVATSGPYLLALDAARGRRLGRFRGDVALPRYNADSLAVSGLLVAPGDVAPTREAMERAAPPALRLPATRPLRVYAELYGLAADSGVARYDAVYRFERTRGGPLAFLAGSRVTTIVFTRERPAADPAVESLVIDPGRLPRGHYRVTLSVRDRVRGARAAGAELQFDLR